MKLTELDAAVTINLTDLLYAVQTTTGVQVTVQQLADAIVEAKAASHVANADATSLATLATSVDNIRDALVTAGFMKTV